jgi:hypothetical protein
VPIVYSLAKSNLGSSGWQPDDADRTESLRSRDFNLISLGHDDFVNDTAVRSLGVRQSQQTPGRLDGVRPRLFDRRALARTGHSATKASSPRSTIIGVTRCGGFMIQGYRFRPTLLFHSARESDVSAIPGR